MFKHTPSVFLVLFFLLKNKQLTDILAIHTIIWFELFAGMDIFPTFASRFGGRGTVRGIKKKEFERRAIEGTWQGLFEFNEVLKLQKIKKIKSLPNQKRFLPLQSQQKGSPAADVARETKRLKQ